ncbi:crossover junction endodeoxyribonuclease RuvC [Sphingomonas sp. LR60]|jgi:crossover junction endodeoxyribonuclease RuvC|uniref:crossover junction endodeoxyribonuclease RuvC n=1 Tax=Sphingomonas TaxID=13687 RepID=UPI0003FA46ED|nr:MULTISPECIES: crossover junction endodeoxyribonuclease RuvC [Sphingomonas]VXC53504.1 component of RuvABC resolvasome, endonuclease [Sphingomonas sp. 8AM]
MIILGLDPGLGTTGWGVIRAEGNRLSHVGNGQIRTDPSMPLPRRLANLYAALIDVIRAERPDEAAVEEVLGNTNAQSTLKLGQARGVVLLAASGAGLTIGEYHPSTVKKAVVGTGGAEKRQIQAMMAVLLPGAKLAGPDAADALAVAICHAHHVASAQGMMRRARAGA